MLRPKVVLDILQNFTLFATDKKHRRIKTISRYQQYFTTIHKFAEVGGQLNQRSNIIVMVDEAHRTQEGDLGRKMRDALPNAFLFGLTGTPINRADKNTFWAFGADEDEKGYLSRYSFQESIRDKATLPLHFEAPEVKLKIDKAAIDEAYRQITGNLNEQDRDDLAKCAAKMAVLVKNPERVRTVVNHIVRHFRTKVEPNGFKAQVVVFDRECCVLYKAVMDERIVTDIDEIVKKVRFPNWQHTSQGERLVQKELRRTLLKYRLHTDQELFDKAYGYIRQYY